MTWSLLFMMVPEAEQLVLAAGMGVPGISGMVLGGDKK
jgi:hypothetical protein